MLSIVALLVLGLAPGVYAALASRKLLRRLDDPVLPDLLHAHSRRVGTVVGSCIGLGITFSRDLTPFFIVLAALSALAGGYPVRKRVFEESWGLWGYLGHSLRFWTGLLGSLSLVYFLPAVTTVSLLAGVVLAALVALWAPFGTDVFRKLVRARPLDAPELDEPFSRVLMKATCERPALFEAEALGGNWVNAFALPSVRRPGVLFTRGLLDALTPFETTAIFAHEVAHLEHHTRTKTARGIAALYALAAIALFLWGGPYAEATRPWAFLWPIGLLGMSLLRASRARAHETESDLRALELCLDPESLVSALVKIHTRLRLARRWDAAHESVSTHPSLARRIQAIRRAAGGDELEGAPETFPDLLVRSSSSDEAVLFEREQMHWLRGIPENEEDVLARSRERKTYGYEELRELRVRGSFDKQELVFRSASPRITTMDVAAADVAALEVFLDRVDGKLATALPPPSREASVEAGRLASAALVVVSMLSYSFGTVALAILGIVRPARVVVTAAGAAGLGWALWTSLRSEPPGELTFWRVALVVLVSAACLAVAWKGKGERADNKTDVGLAVGGLLLLVAIALPNAVRSLFSSLPMMELHLWARTSPTVFTGLVGMCAVLVTRPRAPARIGAASVLALALSFLFLGSLPFRERCHGELFAETGSRIPLRAARLEKLREAIVPGRGYRLVLSPHGERFALAIAQPGDDEDYDDYELFYELDYRVETEEGRLDQLRALALDYLDEDRLLVLEKEERRAALRIVSLPDLQSSTVVEDLPLLPGVELQVDAALGAFQLTGTDVDERELVVVRGRLDSGPVEEVRVPLGGDVAALAAVSVGGVAISQSYEIPRALRAGSGILPYWLLVGTTPRFIKELSLIRPDEARTSLGKTALDAFCFRGPMSEPRFVCSATDSERTGIWSFDPESGRFRAIGFLYGHGVGEIARDGRVVLRTWERAPALVDVETGRGLLLEGLDDPDYGVLAVRGSRMAAVQTDPDRDETVVTLYTVE